MAFFRRNKNRKSVAVLVLLIVVAVGGYFLFNNLKKASAEWFDSNWFYRQAVTITVTSSSSDVSNLDTWFTMNTSALISTSKMQTSCQDLRFTNASGKVLPYYISSGCNTTATKIWVKIDLVPKNSTTYTLYAYYGNPNAIAATDPIKFNLYNGLLGYWNMNEALWNGTAGEVKDLSVNANNGVRAGDATTTTGKFGNGGVFDGGYNDYVNIAANTILKFGTNDFTLEAWINIVSVSDYPAILSNYNASDQVVQIWVYADGKFSVVWRDAPITETTIFSDNAVNDGNWHHVVAQRSGDYMYLYVDGIKQTNEGTGVDNANFDINGEWQIGRQKGNSTRFFNGLIDDVRIYNRALSAAEVLQSYRDSTSSILTAVQGQSVPSVAFGEEEKGPAPVAYWKFDEGQGITVYDNSSNNNDGTLGTSPANPIWQTGDMCVTGKCLKFDGTDDYVDINTFPLGNTITNATYELWIKRKTGDVTNSELMYTNGDGIVGGILQFGFFHSGNNISFIVDDRNYGGVSVNVNAPSTYGAWDHFAGVKEGTTIRIYKNGILVQESTNASLGNNFTGMHDLLIGAGLTSGPTVRRWVKADIDDVRIYPYARTAAQIKADYNARGTAQGTSANLGVQPLSWMSNGLVGYWKMDESAWTVDCNTASVIDSSGAGNNGKACPSSTGPAGGASGKFGNGGFLDGSNDYISIPDSSSLGLTSAITISTWVKLTLDETTQYKDLFDKRTSGTWVGEYNIGYRGNGAVEFTIIGNPAASAATGTLVTATWTHLVFRFDGATEKIYKDGVEVATQPATTAITGNSDPLFIGARADLYAQEFTSGTVDDVRIYNRALSPKEVSDLYNWAPGPVGYWKMDDKVSGASQTLVDASTYGNNGTTYSANGTGMNCKIIGKYGGGCLFDGVDDYVGINLISDLSNLSGGVTISYWIYPKSKTGDYVGHIRAGFSTTPAKRLNIAFNSNGDIWLYTSDGAWHDTGKTLNLNVWSYVTVLRDNSNYIRLYINGTNTGYSLAYSGSFDWSDGINIGRHTNTLNGLIDDVKIYNYARTQKQIMEDMLGSPEPGGGGGNVLKGYAAYWKFDEGHDNSI